MGHGSKKIAFHLVNLTQLATHEVERSGEFTDLRRRRESQISFKSSTGDLPGLVFQDRDRPRNTPSNTQRKYQNEKERGNSNCYCRVPGAGSCVGQLSNFAIRSLLSFRLYLFQQTQDSVGDLVLFAVIPALRIFSMCLDLDSFFVKQFMILFVILLHLDQ